MPLQEILIWPNIHVIKAMIKLFIRESALLIQFQTHTLVKKRVHKTLYFQQTLQWRHNKRNGASNRRRLDCLLNRLLRRRWKKTSKLRVTGLCERNSPVTGEFTSRRTSFHLMTSSWKKITIGTIPWHRSVFCLLAWNEDFIIYPNTLPL